MKNLKNNHPPSDGPQVEGRAKLRGGKNSFTVWVIFFCVFFGVLFPKGGIAVGNIPVTWGYLLLGLVSGFYLLKRLFVQKISYPRKYLWAFLGIIPFALIVLVSFMVNGWKELGFAASLLTSAILLPCIFLLFLGPFFNSSPYVPLLIRYVKYAAVGAAIFGLVLFAYKQATGKFVEVPFLTTNGLQEKTLEQRHNSRGDIFKLISTYNNGNIYGICTLMLLPMCLAIPRAKLGGVSVFVAVIFTLSRTAWAGAIIVLFFKFFRFDRNTGKRFLLFCVTFLALGISAAVYFYVSGKGLAWIFDSSLGGRSDQLESVQEIESLTFLPERKFSVIAEMVYISMLNSFGVIGLAAYVFSMCWPLAVAFASFKTLINPHSMRTAALQGALIYLVISFVDGAYLLIPVMAFYWFMVAVALRRQEIDPEEI